MDESEKSTPEELAAHSRQLDWINGTTAWRRRMREGLPADTSYPSEWHVPAPRHRPGGNQ